jgi:hypothetical protein
MSKYNKNVTLKEYVDQRFDDADKAVQAAIVAQEKAIIKAESAAERRFELLNELRSGVATKDEVKALEKVVEDLKTSRDKVEGRGAGINQFIGWIVAAAAIIGLLIKFTVK